MRRVVSVFLPDFLIEWRRMPMPAQTPVVVAQPEGQRRLVLAANAAARALGVHSGQVVAAAQARVAGLRVVAAEPQKQAAALRQLALTCLRQAPLVAADPPDGIWLDATGCAHLLGGEAALLADLRTRLQAAGYTAVRAAIADAPGAAHAWARFGPADQPILPAGADLPAALAALPMAALRLPLPMQQRLRRFGLVQVGQLASLPRDPCTHRFGPLLLQRLDQALGRRPEPIVPIQPPRIPAHRLTFPEPLATAESLAAAIAVLTQAVCGQLERGGLGARELDLLFTRVDGSWQAIRVGTSRPHRGVAHLSRLLRERLEAVDPGLGVEAMQLLVPRAERLAWSQPQTAGEATGDLAELVDRLAGRLGEARVFRVAPVESRVPERSVRRIPAMAPPTRAGWPPELPRPARLLRPPQPVTATALLPDYPPSVFVWRRVHHRVRHADGPERVRGEWWKRDAAASVRDYFAVEDEAGQRFWLFRYGDGRDPESGDLRWFLHGLF